MRKFPLTDWQAEHTRLTVFPMPDAANRSVAWWQNVTDSQPDETTMNPKKGTGQIQGEFDPGRLVLRWEPDRIDWLFAPLEREVNELMAAREFPTLGPVTEMTRLFSAIAERWLIREDVPAIWRMAFGAALIHPEADRRAAYLRLPDYVPVRVNPESSDFLYQINLPPAASATGIEGLRVNQLSKWNVVGLKTVSFSLTDKLVQAQRAPEMFGVRLELDINTVPDFPGPIPRGQLVEIYHELVATAEALASNGVIQ